HKGDRIEARFWGLNAICFQHELDHLNGVTFDTRVSKLKWNNAKKKKVKDEFKK
ncbi:MAG TPA: peptide deformylase, partial [Flavobacteriaceae bacterium]|nr:peptide deformylase [Flavobacteriaceae bacterium]